VSDRRHESDSKMAHAAEHDRPGNRLGEDDLEV